MCVRKLCKIVESYPVATSGVQAGFHSVNTCNVFINCVVCSAFILHYHVVSVPSLNETDISKACMYGVPLRVQGNPHPTCLSSRLGNMQII